MNEETKAGPTHTKIRWPGIVPVFQYPFNPKWCMSKADSRYGDDSWIHAQNARYSLYHPLYGIAKFRNLRGEWNVADCGVLFTLLYDFCGGMLVSSAFVRSYITRDNGWGDGYWRTFYGSADGEHSRRQAAASAISRWPEWQDKIPDLHAYCGPDAMSPTAAESVMRDSLAAAIITVSWNYGRRGVFAADRTASSPYTRNTLSLGAKLPHAYGQLPGVALWGGTHGRARTEARSTYEEPKLYKSGAHFAPGHTYRNPNSGHDVAMCGLIVDQCSGNHSVVHRPTKELTPWEVPQEEAAKLANTALFELFPQSLFHNA